MLIVGYYLDIDKRRLGQKIKERREAMGFKKQEDLASRLGVDQSRISKWETGANEPDDYSKGLLKEVLQVDDGFFVIQSAQQEQKATLLNELSSFLAKLAELSPEQRDLVFALVFDDESYLDGRPALSQAFSILGGKPEKES